MKSRFERDDTPTQDDFADLIDTLGQNLELVQYLTGSLLHRADVSYPPNSVVLTYQGIWYNLDPVLPGEFQPAQWVLMFSFDQDATNARTYAFPDWSPSETYTTDDRVAYLFKLFKYINAEASINIPPTGAAIGVYWQEVSAAPDEFGIRYDQLWSENGGEFIGKVGQVIRKTVGDELRLYEATFPGEFGAVFLSLDFATELAEEKWKYVGKESSGGGVSLGETSSTAYRGDRGKTAYDYSQVGHVTLANKTDDVSSNTGSSTKVPSTKGVADYVAVLVESGTWAAVISWTSPFSGTNGIVNCHYTRLGNVVTFSLKSFIERENYPNTEETCAVRVVIEPLPNATTTNNVVATFNMYCTDPTFDGAFVPININNDTISGGRLLINFISKANTASPLATYRFEITITGQYLIEPEPEV